MREFPHLNDTNFPNVGNVDVYKYANDFNYTRYDYTQMEICVCSVPWDLGEARIGNRTISGIGNVVYFETKAERDAWFDAIPDGNCFRWSTKLKELHRANTIDVPIPFDIAAKYNYVYVRYALFANDGSPVEYETDEGLREWFWFIREVEFLAPNTTRLHLLNDAWQTFIYDLDVTGMVLERGHAPMFQTKADRYLSNPKARAANLLSPDYVSDNAAYTSAYESELVFNSGDDVLALVVTTANPVNGSWGSKSAGTWRCDARRHFNIQGVPDYCVFAVDADNLSTLLTNIDAQAPQFMQTVKAICFVSADFVTLSTAFTFCDVACNMVTGSYKTNDLLELTKAQFGYADEYADIAKLYTYPYAYIEVSDENGNVTEIRIETTSGTLQLATCANLVFPFLKINGHLNGIGNAVSKSVSFRNMTARSIPVSGSWYEHLMQWNIPTFGVVQDAGTRNDYNTHFDREQMVTAYTNAYNSAVASANTAETNANASADAMQANENANADTMLANAALQTAANSAITATNNATLVTQNSNQADYLDWQELFANAVTNGTANAQAQADQQSASIASAASQFSSGINAASQMLSGNIIGGIGAGLSGQVQAAETMAQATVSVNLTTGQAGIATAANSAFTSNAKAKNQYDMTAQQDNATSNNATNNGLISGSSSNTAATVKANATRTRNTEIANAGRTNDTDVANAGRTRNTAINAVNNQIAQARLDQPAEYGAFGYADSATTRPVGAFANIVTMDDYSIHAVGDEFLRYGYMFGRQWEFDGNWNVGDKFTYWKLSDFWVKGLNIADMYVDKLRFFLFGGVTVWRRPEYIGNTSIYDNGI